MDIYNEITRLPQYYYEWKSGWGIWGWDYYNKEGKDIGDHDIIISIWKQLKAYYEKDGDREQLPDEEKEEYAKAVERMRIYCKKGDLTDEDFNMDELKRKIGTLPEEDKREIGWQVDMYNRGQRYYSQYVNNR